MAYLHATGTTYREFEERSGVPFPVLNAIAHGKKGWSPELGLCIVEASGRAITLEAMAETRRKWLEENGRPRRTRPTPMATADTS